MLVGCNWPDVDRQVDNLACSPSSVCHYLSLFVDLGRPGEGLGRGREALVSRGALNQAGYREAARGLTRSLTKPSILLRSLRRSYLASISEVRRRHESRLLTLPNVIGVSAETTDRGDVLIVLVRRKVPRTQLAPEEVIPQQIEGFPTDVVEIGEPTAPPTG